MPEDRLERTRQNQKEVNCRHTSVMTIKSDIGTFQLCMQCGKRQDILTLGGHMEIDMDGNILYKFVDHMNAMVTTGPFTFFFIKDYIVVYDKSLHREYKIRLALYAENPFIVTLEKKY